MQQLFIKRNIVDHITVTSGVLRPFRTSWVGGCYVL